MIPAAKREIFKMGVRHGYVKGGQGQELARSGDLSRGEGQAGMR